MPITKKTVYVTEDGKQFDTKDEAELHERNGALIHTLAEEIYNGTMATSSAAIDVARFIVRNYDIQKKEPQ